MSCLLLSLAPDMTDPRVARLEHRAKAARAMCDTPTRLGWVLTEARDLLRRPDFAPDLAREMHLGNGDLVRIFRAFDPQTPVKRFKDRAAGAKRTAKLLLGLTHNDHEENEVNSEHDHEQTHQHGYQPEHWHEDEATDGANQSEFAPTIGTRVTLLEDESKGFPLEHGVVTEVDGDDYIVTVDPAYRGNGSDPERIVQRDHIGPDPEGVERLVPGSWANAAVDTMQPTTEKPTKKAMREREAAEKREAKRVAREAKAAEKEAAAAEKKAAREQRLAEKSAKASAPKKLKIAGSGGRSGKPAKTASEFKPMTAGSIRARITERMDGTRTIGQIAEEVGLTYTNTGSHISCLHRDCGLGFDFDDEKRVRVLLPHGVSQSLLFKSPKAAA